MTSYKLRTKKKYYKSTTEYQTEYVETPALDVQPSSRTTCKFTTTFLTKKNLRLFALEKKAIETYAKIHMQKLHHTMIESTRRDPQCYYILYLQYGIFPKTPEHPPHPRARPLS